MLKKPEFSISNKILNLSSGVIENQLVHTVKDPNGCAYNHITHLDIRRGMMQTWLDYLETLATG